MSEDVKITIKVLINTIVSVSVVAIGFCFTYKVPKKTPEPKKLYFEFRKKDGSVTADGFIKHKGQWCPIVLNDSTATIYE